MSVVTAVGALGVGDGEVLLQVHLVRQRLQVHVNQPDTHFLTRVLPKRILLLQQIRYNYSISIASNQCDISFTNVRIEPRICDYH